MPNIKDNYIGPAHWWIPFVVFAGTAGTVLAVAAAVLCFTGTLHFCHA